MPVEWIILIAVLLVAVVAGCFIVSRYDGLKPVGDEEPWQVNAAAKAAADVDPEHQQPDIPVWRDKPQPPQEKSP